jgi:hypothetical protein
MTGKEALRLLEKIMTIHNHLIEDEDCSAFFELGALSEELAMIVRVDRSSFNSTVEKEEEEEDENTGI